MRKPRLLIVADSTVARRAISGIVEIDPDLEMVLAVVSGATVLGAIHQSDPDVVILDIERRMSVLEVLQGIRAVHPALPVIVFSTVTSQGHVDTLEALACGTTEFILKPTGVGALSGALRHIREQLAAKVNGLLGSAYGWVPLSSRDHC